MHQSKFVPFLLMGLIASSCQTSDTVSTEKSFRGTLSTDPEGKNWEYYGRTQDENHFSPLTQINDKNVSQLGLAWYQDIPTSISSLASPIAVDGILYTAVGLSQLSAVDALTGKTLWSYDPKVGEVAGDKLQPAWGIRGLAYARGKVLVGTQDGRLVAVDAKTGALAWEVKTTEDNDGRYITGAPRVFNDKVIIGHGGADFGPVRGYVTAYEVDSGKQAWRFYTVPGDPKKGFENKAMENAAKTWKGEWWKQGGGGTVWNAMTYDGEQNLIYLGTGNGAPWNVQVRSPGGGDNLYLCSIVAINADTGEYVWHYQVNPGETWDYNAAMDMQLTTLKIDGKDRKVLLHAPKNGFFYVIDRVTGKPISAEKIAKVTWAERIDMKTGRPVENPEARMPNGEFTMWPGNTGAHSWQPMAFNPNTKAVYIPLINLPTHYNLKGIDPKTWKREPGIAIDNSFTPDPFKPQGAAITTPMGELLAWNPITQKKVWSVTLKGPMNGGISTTAGNLVLQGTADGYFNIYAADTGKSLWSFFAQTGILSEPITYTVNGQQYVTIVSGFGGQAAAWGVEAAKWGWEYRTQKRRLLTFALNGKASLPKPEQSAAMQPLDDPQFKIAAESLKKGTLLFGAHCTLCHGPGAIAGGGAPDLRKSAIPLSEQGFKSIVHDGGLAINGMPKFDKLSDDELLSIRTFIRSEARRALKKK